jgi:hypothetical protein
MNSSAIDLMMDTSTDAQEDKTPTSTLSRDDLALLFRFEIDSQQPCVMDPESNYYC